MKHSSFNHTQVSCSARPPQQRGFIMLALLVIVTLMLIYVAASSRVMNQMQRELTVLERAQIKRLTNSSPATVAVSGVQALEITGDLRPAQ